ncbi:sensor histidine kinase [Reichenbachiella ulvae]|uniref:histidine kinase n=1 Tax=Reichenbachiella ulvae TaxID=2980104 RepID=A0ABT3CQC0_9BACT|nr:HAMP domain-containing sensor histidine kinase [Reichenbachiella ulvae]MCV9385674.1 HAMP domain-containing histidine kinase [Reichenbachiella ulvae]
MQEVIQKRKMSQETAELKQIIKERDQQLKDKQEELEAQRGMLSAAVEELVKKNKRLESTLNELQHGNEELENLLYHSSHGLRTPITNVMGLIQIIKAGDIEDSIKEYIDQIEGQGNHMIEIMNALSSLADLINYKPKKEVQLESFFINELINDRINYLTPLAKENQVTIDYQALENQPPLRCSKFALMEVIKQIMMNGIVFRDNSKPGYLSISAEKKENQLAIYIEDDGDGIDPETQPKIYEMFSRGSEKSGGSGLGLFIAKKAAEIIHADIKFESSQKGTRFIINIDLPPDR